jgi:hypothetical protein
VRVCVCVCVCVHALESVHVSVSAPTLRTPRGGAQLLGGTCALRKSECYQKLRNFLSKTSGVPEAVCGPQ